VTKAPSRTFEEIKKQAKAREAEVSIVLAGDLAADADRLTAALDAIDRRRADVVPPAGEDRAQLASELEEVRELMRSSEVPFRFRALPRTELSALVAAHPGSPDQNWNPETYPPALVAASSLDPKMTVEQVEELFEILNDDQRGDLFFAANRANTSAVSVPSSRVASVNPSLSDAR
jgi:hypothetical protein